MYENLRVEMFKKNISKKELSSLLGIHENTVGNKISMGSFSIEEVFKIKKRYFPEFDLEYLFKKSDTPPNNH